MKTIYTLVIAALLAAPALRADNLDQETSIITPRVQEGAWITVDAGLIYILEKYYRAPGADRAAIEAAKAELATAKANFEKAYTEAVAASEEVRSLKEGRRLAQTNESALAKLSRQYDQQSQVRKKGRYGAGSKMDREMGGHGLGNHRQVAKFDGRKAAQELITEAEIDHARELAKRGTTVTKLEIEAAKNAARDLEAARKTAGELVTRLTSDVARTEAAGLRADKIAAKYRAIRIGTQLFIIGDIAGHVWAFADNSRTPIFLGGYAKLGNEAYDGVSEIIEAMRGKALPPVAPVKKDDDKIPAPPVAEDEDFAARPQRGLAAPQGPVDGQPEDALTGVIEEPLNRLPPLRKTAPEFKTKS